jgi:hypothetical protein
MKSNALHELHCADTEDTHHPTNGPPQLVGLDWQIGEYISRKLDWCVGLVSPLHLRKTPFCH